MIDRNPPARILVVDDEDAIRSFIVRCFKNQPYECREASSAQSAWQLLQAEPFDLITLDNSMPGRSGMQLLQEISKTYPDISIVMLTGVPSVQTAIEAMSFGATSYLQKPINPEDLLFHVHRGLERRRFILERNQYLHTLEQRVEDQVREIREAHYETIKRLVCAAKHRDEETGAHIQRVGLFSGVLAAAAGWRRSEVEMITAAAPMHDIGKIGIPDAVLCKPGKLTREEYDIMKTHAIIGQQILLGSKIPMLEMAAEIAAFHHERWDGTGYPFGLSGESIPESARIVSIVDVFDALTHDRVYRAALPEEQALVYLDQGASQAFDPRLLNCFFDCLDEIRAIAKEYPDEADPAAPSPLLILEPHDCRTMMHGSSSK